MKELIRWVRKGREFKQNENWVRLDSGRKPKVRERGLKRRLKQEKLWVRQMKSAYRSDIYFFFAKYLKSDRRKVEFGSDEGGEMIEMSIWGLEDLI